MAAGGQGAEPRASIRGVAPAYFAREGQEIVWHRHANHGLSSQVCCLNFLMPLAERPDTLARLVGLALGIAMPTMRAVEKGPDERDWFIGFEWTGGPGADHLGEGGPSGKLTRGANATSADAVLMFEGEHGPETLLIEWKYAEAYGPPLTDRRSADGTRGGNLTRTARYADKAFAPDGPIRNDLGLKLDDFFWEPFYQLLRQQMLASRMERATRERTRVLHLSTRANQRLHRVTSAAIGKAAGETDAFAAFAALLQPQPDSVPRFVDRRIEDVFGPLLAESPGDPWAAYLLGRYDFLASEKAD